MSELNEFCYGCGNNNPEGLQLKFQFDGDELWTEVIFEDKYQGYPGVAHGGIVCSVLDEIMATHLYRLGYAAMTADLQVRFKKAVPLGESIRFISRVEFLKKRMWVLTAEAVLHSGERVVTARAKMLPARFEMDGEVHDYYQNA